MLANTAGLSAQIRRSVLPKSKSYRVHAAAISVRRFAVTAFRVVKTCIVQASPPVPTVGS